MLRWLFVVAVAAYLLSPAWPIVPIEGYEAANAALCEYRTAHPGGSIYDEPPTVPIGFQPGSIALVVAVLRLGATDGLKVYGLLSATCAGLFLVLATVWLHRRSSQPAWLCSLVLLGIPEVYVASYYPSSSMMALPFLPAALLTFGDGTSWPRALATAALIAFGTWIRLDLAFLAPAVVLQSRTWSRAILVGAIVALLVPMAYSASGWPLHVVLREDNAAFQTPTVHRVVMVLCWSIPVWVGAAYLVGLRDLAIRHNYRELLIAVSGPMLILAAYRLALIAPRYFLGAVPFLAYGILQAAPAVRDWSASQRRVGAIALAVLMASGFLPFVQDYIEGPRSIIGIGAYYLPVSWHQLKAKNIDAVSSVQVVGDSVLTPNACTHFVAGDWFGRCLWAREGVARCGGPFERGSDPFHWGYRPASGGWVAVLEKRGTLREAVLAGQALWPETDFALMHTQGDWPTDIGSLPPGVSVECLAGDVLFYRYSHTSNPPKAP
ncbi:MAG: hypothetical protein U0746_06030 [Gemmataceae bacterium]